MSSVRLATAALNLPLGSPWPDAATIQASGGESSERKEDGLPNSRPTRGTGGALSMPVPRPCRRRSNKETLDPLWPPTACGLRRRHGKENHEGLHRGDLDTRRFLDSAARHLAGAADVTEPRIVNLDVRVEDGLVLRRGKVIWVRCPECGPQPPETAWHEALGCLALVTRTAVYTFAEGPFSCSVCSQDAPCRYATIPKDGAKPHTKCNRRCTEGKAICNCHCQGKCHGEGHCFCKEDANA